VAASPREIIGHGRHLEIIHHFGNLTLPVDAYFLEEYSCQISYPSKLKQRSLQLFEEVTPKATRRRTDDLKFAAWG